MKELYLTKEQQTAVKDLGKLRINDIRSNDIASYQYGGEYKCYFDFIWWDVLREYDLWVEKEHEELSKRDGEDTKKWLKKYQKLTEEFNKVEI